MHRIEGMKKIKLNNHVLHNHLKIESALSDWWNWLKTTKIIWRQIILHKVDFEKEQEP